MSVSPPCPFPLFTLWWDVNSSHSSILGETLTHVFTVSSIHNSHFPQGKHLGTPLKSSWSLTVTSTPWGITCVQPFKNKALRPPQPLTSAWMPSLVTWSHQEMFNCSNSGHPSLRIKQNETSISLPPIPKPPGSSLWCSRGTVSLGRVF